MHMRMYMYMCICDLGGHAFRAESGELLSLSPQILDATTEIWEKLFGKMSVSASWAHGGGAPMWAWPSSDGAGDQRHARRGERRIRSTAELTSVLRQRAPANLGVGGTSIR